MDPYFLCNHMFRFKILFIGFCLASLTTALKSQFQATGQLISGRIDSITLANPADTYSAGTMVVGGLTIIIPANLVIGLPANRLTLRNLFRDAPPNAVLAGVTGLALADGIAGNGGAFAVIRANRQVASGNLIAGD
ncbi:MAG: hypothetical protein WCR59_04795, partial [Planctomycetota bacterium]